jgi:Zn-dependent protease with chaperone function
MSRSPSLAGRAVAAVALMIGFYLLAIVTAAVLLWIPYAEVAYANRIHFQLTFACLIGAAIILWSVVPRPDRFRAPGPELRREDHPQLFERIDTIARSTSQQGPSEIYLLPDVNAWVSSRGGFMGLGSRRVMGLGLPLMHTVTVSELSAVLAHEFGHYHGGDVAMGPWVHQTRAAIGRTLRNLEQHSGLIQKPFAAYGRMFLRITHGISRAQEYAADALAARVAGTAAMKSGLRRILESSAAFQAYWGTEFEPLLVAGFRAPLAAGFHQFLRSPSIAERAVELRKKEETEGESDLYDTHPSLKERLSALDLEPESEGERDDRPAASLLADPDGLEIDLLRHLIVAAHFEKLQSVSWDHVGSRVLVPQWNEVVKDHSAVFAGVTFGALAERMQDPEPLLQRLPDPLCHQPREQQLDFLRWAAGAAIAAELVRRGGSPSSLPGEPVVVHTPAGDVPPFEWTSLLGTEGVDPLAWRERCRRHGIEEAGWVSQVTESGPTTSESDHSQFMPSPSS